MRRLASLSPLPLIIFPLSGLLRKLGPLGAGLRGQIPLFGANPMRFFSEEQERCVPPFRAGTGLCTKLGHSRFAGRSILALPTERGEALTVTDFQAVCHRSLFISWRSAGGVECLGAEFAGGTGRPSRLCREGKLELTKVPRSTTAAAGIPEGFRPAKSERAVPRGAGAEGHATPPPICLERFMPTPELLAPPAKTQTGRMISTVASAGMRPTVL